MGDLEQAFNELPDQSIGRGGVMQKALYRYGPTTTAIFAFEDGAGLDEYRADAEAIIHVIHGRIRVTTPAGTYELSEDQLLLIDPDVPQNLMALEPTRVLMTIVCEEGE